MNNSNSLVKRIELGDNWMIDIDAIGNHTLKEEYVGKDTKTGEDKIAYREHGHFSDVPNAINQLFKKKSFKLMKDKQGVRELGEIYNKTYKECKALLKKFEI